MNSRMELIPREIGTKTPEFKNKPHQAKERNSMSLWKLPFIAEPSARKELLAHIAADDRCSKNLDEFLDLALSGASADDLNIRLAIVLDMAIESYTDYRDQPKGEE